MPGHRVTLPPGRFNIVVMATLPSACIQALEASTFGPFDVECFGAGAGAGAGGGDIDGEQALARLMRPGCDALLIDLDAAVGLHDAAAAIASHTATLVVTCQRDAATALAWLRHGAQEVIGPDDLLAASLPARIRAAIERKRLEREARTAYATDLDTGLPHQQQLIEHMSHLLALREREPAPMALLALRVEGLATTEARLGREAANVLRRRVAVRLRAGVRASDVVAALGDDSFAVLLGALLSADDAARVGAKLMAALMKPFTVAGSEVTVAVALGIGQYPQDGAQPDALLRRAVGLAAAAQAQGRAGFANFVEAGGTAVNAAPSAANDD